MIRQSLQITNGFWLAIAGLVIVVVSLLLLFAISAYAVIGLIAGGSMVIAGFFWTLRTRTRAERF